MFSRLKRDDGTFRVTCQYCGKLKIFDIKPKHKWICPACDQKLTDAFLKSRQE